MRHRSNLSPINTNKHYVPQTNLVIASGARHSLAVATSVVAPAAATVDQVREGSIIKAVYLEYWIANTGASDTDDQFIFVFEKAPSNTPGATFTNMTNLQSYPNKKNVLFTSQGVISPQVDGATSIPVVRQWFKIPKGKQRMGFTDRLLVGVATIGTTLNLCGIAIYKEYR